MNKLSVIKPYFSIITVVKNDEKNIKKTINSVLKQNYKNYEYLIIDGKSTDRTVDNIKRFKKFKLVSNKDKGIYDAMNKGIKLSKGEVIVFINSGDTFTKNALKFVKKQFDIEEKSHLYLVQSKDIILKK